MRKKQLGIIIIAIMVFMMTACGSSNNEQTKITDKVSENLPVSETTSYKEIYNTSIFLGDSITEGLLYHEALSEEQIVAGAGKTAQIALETGDVDEVVTRKPEHIYIHLGSTDILWPTDDPLSYSLSYYAKLLEEIKAQIPDTEITLLSVTPVTAEAEKANPKYRFITEYNKRLEALAAEKQVGYIDLSPLFDEHFELYDTDGIHFQAEFYPLLLTFLQEESDGR
ncbi:GDSL-type esterase/lipase family protein [Paenibacillus sp. ClWae2A]|uniref:GDSL-type esterase/lipase family protein n=1 Tax=Paenibacillus sp. ClWae2A TaxID=3057177 RepID=UPI0028F7035F|nr:GDSL-type esterase/lipase family protein [Paenibacillus sp. ClWae2A]